MTTAAAAMAGVQWTDEDTRKLIDVWGEDGIQSKLAGSNRNMRVFEEIAERCRDVGMDRTAVQCREKIKKLKAEWRKGPEHNTKGGKNWKFYDSMAAVLGDRSSTDSANNRSQESMSSITQNIDQQADDIGTEWQGSPSDHNLSNSEMDSCIADTIETELDGIEDMTGTAGARKKTSNGPKRGRSSVISQYLEMQKSFRDDLLAWEERQRKADAEMERARQAEEHRHEERLFGMFLQAMQPVTCQVINTERFPLQQ